MSANTPKSVVQNPGFGSGEDASIGPADGSFSGVGFLLRMFLYRAICYFLSHLWFLRSVFDLLRVVRPVSLFANTLIVTRASEVREVLERFDDFLLGEFIEPGMPWGPFIMTVDWRERHALERGVLQQAVHPTDVEVIRLIARGAAEVAIKGAANSRLDLVTELAEPVMVELFREYFGIPPVDSPQKMAQVMRSLASIIMVDPPVGSRPWNASRENMSVLTAHLVTLLMQANRDSKQSSQNPQPFLSRLISLRNASSPSWFNDDWMLRYLTGLVATGAATVVRGTTHAVDQLLANPEALRRAQAIAVELVQNEENWRQCECAGFKTDLDNSRVALQKWIYEALRFRPMLPLLIRDCPRDTVVAKGTPRERLVPGGTRIIAPPLAAMFDSREFQDPSCFAERPLEKYLHFGRGPRECFGRYIADTVMQEIVRALLRLPYLARADGSAGRVQYQGPVPCSLILTLRASRGEER